ncbi:MAG TPA: hypothetical protein VKA16_09425 [Burkholderiales bacterium]|nr:hypothetical protein [Burkholderiales bacterium]
MSLRPQRGIALIALVAVIALGASWYMVHRLNTDTGLMTAVVRERNAEALNRAKQALIGYVANDTADAAEQNPGRLPCPEAPGSFDNPSTEGTAAGTCTLPAVGRLPWRTLGLDKLVDAAGEPLWYVVSPGWAYSGSNLTINSNTPGQLTVDSVANSAVALIIAPGPAFAAQASGPCAAKSQTRPTSGTPDPSNYLECQNAVGSTFVTTGPSVSFNDQVLRVTAADVIPGIEAAIADRIQRQIVPVLKTVYAPSTWGFSGSNPVYPFAAPFANPGPGSGTSNYQGVATSYQGLLPFNQTQGCTASASNPRCLPHPALVTWQSTPAPAVEVYGYGYIQTQSCSWQSGNDVRECTGEYHEYNYQPWRPIRIEMTATFTNVAMGLRALDATKFTVEAKDDTSSGPWLSLPPTYTIALNNGSAWGKPLGSATITFGATLPNIDAYGWGTYADFRIRIDRNSISDHSLLDATNPTTGWFVRNDWFRLVYYAAAKTTTAAYLPSVGCTTSTSGLLSDNCLRLTTWPSTAVAGDKRALLLLAGRTLTGASRPNGNIADYVEFGNNDGGTLYEQDPIRSYVNAALKAPFNDRVMVVDSN